MSGPLFLHGLRTKRSQSGLSLILLVFLLGLALTGLGIKYLSAGSLQIQRSVDSAQALAKAKAAVIGNVISGQSGTSAGQFPCSEDTTLIGFATEGQAKGSCSNTLTSIGRFAWRTLGTGDLRDGNNDKLWYALSAGFRATPVNSDTIGGLAIDGVQNQAIAILFSPGGALSSQSRPTPTAPSGPNVANYLDGENNNGDAKFVTGPVSASFNDKLLAIKPDDIFPVLEKRVLGEIKNYLVAYKAIWHAYPFPAPFSDPSTASYIGSSSITGGLLPIADAGLTWGSSIWTSVRSSNGSIRAGSCVASGGNTVLTCTISGQGYNGARALTIYANLKNVGLGFYQQMDVNSTLDFQITPAAVKTTSTLSYGLNGTGDGAITLTATPTTSSNTYRIIFKRLPQLDNWNTTTAIPNYIYRNNWHQLIYYKVAQPFLPGGTSTCGALCLTVNKINVTPNTTQTGIHALLISAGRKLDATNAKPSPTYGTSNPAQARPGSSLADYFDSANNIPPGGLIFDSTNHPLTTFNDQIKIVEP